MSKAVCWFVLPARGGRPRPEDTGRLVEMTGPLLDSSAIGQHPGPDFRMPGELVARNHADQYLFPGSSRRGRAEVAGPAGSGQADHSGGQPGRGLLIGGKTREDAV